MTDTTLNRFISSGTHAQRLAFTPVQATPASGPSPSAFWFETDTGNAFAWNFGSSAWTQITSSGGGAGSNYKGYFEPKLSTGNTFAAGNWGGRSSVMDENCTLNSVVFGSTAAVATAHVQAAIYSNVSNIPTTLLASSSVVLGVTAGLNTLTLTSPLVVTQGQALWIGVLVTTTGVPTWNGSGVGTAFFGSAGPAPATAGACSFVNALEINFWASK